MPLRAMITESIPRADCKEALPLINGMSNEALLEDQAFDVDYIIEGEVGRVMEVVTAPKKNKKKQRKTNTSINSALPIRCLSLWIKI